MPATNYIVLQCYGDEGVFCESTYALLSLSRLYSPGELDNTEIWFYTDKPEWFKNLKDCWLPLHFRTIDEALIKQWRGSSNFVHRVKIEALRDFVQTHEGNILYCDTDVVFTHRIDEVFRCIGQGRLFMHVMEGIVSHKSNPILAKLDAHLRANVSMTVREKPLQDLAMWNAGILGFNTSKASLLDEVLAFTDREHPRFPKHVVEQFAFSVFFQREEHIKAAAPFIVHYWNLKEARTVLASFFAHFKGRSWSELVTRSTLVQMHVLMQEKTNFYIGRSIGGKIQKKIWQPAAINWHEAERQVCG